MKNAFTGKLGAYAEGQAAAHLQIGRTLGDDGGGVGAGAEIDVYKRQALDRVKLFLFRDREAMALGS